MPVQWCNVGRLLFFFIVGCHVLLCFSGLSGSCLTTKPKNQATNWREAEIIFLDNPGLGLGYCNIVIDVGVNDMREA